MPYGNQGQTSIGAGYNPAMGIYDYSGYVDAAKTQAAGITNAIGMVTNAGLDVLDERKKNKQQITASKQTAKAIAQLIPELQPVLDEQISLMDDEERPLSERAGVASAITDILNLGTAEIKGRAMLGLEAKRIQLAERETDSIVNARNMDISTAQETRQTNREVAAAIAPAKLNALITAFQASPSTKDVFTPEFLEKAKNMRPEAQLALADTMISLLPPKDQEKFVADFPVNVGGTNAKIPGVVQGNTFYPAQIAGQQAGISADGTMLPSLGIQTEEGPEIPFEESKVVDSIVDPQGNTVTRYEYLGKQYHAVKPPQMVPGNIQGQDPMSPTEKIAVEKHDAEMKAAAAKDVATVAEASAFKATLEELETHPGFTNLFGTNFGIPTWVDGSAGADAEAILGKVQGKAFLEAIQKMRGMGALSEKEGATATKAYSALTPSMSEVAARKEIKALREQLDVGIERMQSGNLVNPDGTPKPRETTILEKQADAASRMRGMLRTQ